MTKNETKNSEENSDINLPAYEYADKHLIEVVYNAIQYKCDAFIFMWLKKEPGKDKVHEHIYQGNTEDLLFLLDYMKAIILKEIIGNGR